MRGKWPHDAITAEINRMMGLEKEQVDNPLRRLADCDNLLGALAYNLYLTDPDRVLLAELGLRVLTEVVHNDRSPEVQMARELITISAYEPVEIVKILGTAREARVRPIDKDRGIHAKSCRQYLAGYSQQPRVSATKVSKLQKYLPRALNDALFKYVDERLDQAQAIAHSVGLTPQTDDQLVSTSIVDPLAAQSQQGAAAPDTEESSVEPYVRRSLHEAAFRRLRNERARVICFTGPPGMGKTRLAEGVTASEKHPDGVTVRIDAGSNEQLERSLHDALRKFASESPPYGLPALEAAFRQHVTEHPPWYLFIDSVGDSTVLRRLVPSEAETTVVLTASQRLAGIADEDCIDVERLEPHESTELILSLMPAGVTKEDADKLASTLDHHPMAITAACGMIGHDPSISIHGFCTGLRDSAAIVFEGVADDGRQNLTAIYRQTLSTLDQADPQARLMLELLALLGDGVVDSSVLVLSLGHVSGYRNMSLDQLKLIARRALKQLKDRFLVSTTGHGVRMHQLTSAILQGLIVDRSTELGAVLLDGIFDVCKMIAESESAKKEILALFPSVFAEVGEHLTSVCNVIRGRNDTSLKSYIENIYEACTRILMGMGLDLHRVLIAVVAHSGTSYRTMLVTSGGDFPIQLGVELDRAELEQATGPSGQLVVQKGSRTYRVKGQDAKITVMWVARREDLE
jgi:hypothetical protein